MTIRLLRQPEVPNRQVLESLLLQTLRAAMPRAGAQGFSEEALVNGEVGRILKMLAAMLLPNQLAVRNLAVQLTGLDVRSPYLDAWRRSRGFPPPKDGERITGYLERVLNGLMNQGLTMPNIRANLQLLGYEAELAPMAKQLLVFSKRGRSLSSKRGLFPSMRTKAGVYRLETWSPWWTNAGILEVLDALTSAGYDWNWRHHIHWNGPGDVVVTPTTEGLSRVRLHDLPKPCREALVPSTRHGGLSRKIWPLSGRKRVYGIYRTRYHGAVVPEANILAFLPVPVDSVNRYVQLVGGSLNNGTLAYNVVSEDLRVDSQVTCLQAGFEITPRS